MIAVFAYAFAHRKTHDFLCELALAGLHEVTVIGAPMQRLAGMDRTRYFRSTAPHAPPMDTALLCERLGFHFTELSHGDSDAIAELVRTGGLRLGIVSGARILKRAVIECFEEGIVNFHPGKIPETSGLDAFFYTVKNRVDAGVTTHFIDARVDAGDFLAFDAVPVQADDTLEDIQAKGYALQIVALRRFLHDWQAGNLLPRPINRPAKNAPMEPAEKWRMLQAFPAWRAARFVEQRGQKLITLCETGDQAGVMALLDEVPELLEYRTEKGWTPLVVAAFNQHRALVGALLAAGADPNAAGAKGTTVLMYAKTALMPQEAPDTGLLDDLIAAGADVGRCDVMGKDILHYVRDCPALHAYFSERLA